MIFCAFLSKCSTASGPWVASECWISMTRIEQNTTWKRGALCCRPDMALSGFVAWKIPPFSLAACVKQVRNNTVCVDRSCPQLETETKIIDKCGKPAEWYCGTGNYDCSEHVCNCVCYRKHFSANWPRGWQGIFTNVPAALGTPESMLLLFPFYNIGQGRQFFTEDIPEDFFLIWFNIGSASRRLILILGGLG